MSEAGQKAASACAIALVRGYAEQDAVAVASSLVTLDTFGQARAYAVLGAQLQSTLSIVEVAGLDIGVCRLVRLADFVASAAPPHYEFAVSEAVRAWARDDPGGVRQVCGEDLEGALHVSAVFVAALGLALWGQDTFLGVLTEYGQNAQDLMRE
ncbi:hypothetical protein PUR49_07700 [Streptomyces sp. BE147]|uniref:hypothetical protein n=1 Tax=Streptomyces sp. BE147 TaxID=3002524 RepID=UPI002E7927E0|nr:hypothetical protein [Streptomyces sp. BE147]MEE1736385.1 hypothetical protein [Streptomyces sp. BE147]